MAEIPTSNYYSKIQSRVQSPSQNPAYQARDAAGRAKFAASETAIQGTLGLAESIAGLVTKIQANKDSLRADEMAADLSLRYIELENESLSPNTAYISAKGNERNAEALRENSQTIIRTHAEIAEYENLIAEESNIGTSGALGRITNYRAKIDGANTRLNELGYESKALGTGKKNYEMAGGYYQKMLEDFESAWELGSETGGFATKKGRDTFMSYYREQKNNLGDAVHDKIIQYEIPEQARRQRKLVGKYAALHQPKMVIAMAQKGTESGLWDEVAQNTMLDEEFYTMGYDRVQSDELDALKQFEPGMENWLLDDSMYEGVKTRLGELRTFMYENHDGSMRMLSREDQNGIKRLADNEWKRIEAEHREMRRDASFEFLNEGLQLLSQGKLSEQFLRDKRGEAYDGGIYTDGVSQHLRNMMPKGKSPEDDEFTELRNLMDNPEQEAHIMARIMSQNITDDALQKYILMRTGGWGMSVEQGIKVMEVANSIRKKTGMDFPSEGFDGAQQLEDGFAKAKGKALDGKDYERYAELTVAETNAYGDFYGTILKNLQNEFYFTENGLDALKKLPTNILRRYIDDDIRNLLDDASKEVAYTNIGMFADGVTTSELEKMQFLIQNNNSHGYKGALSQVLIGMKDVYAEKFQNETGIMPYTSIAADNTVELFVPTNQAEIEPDNKYLVYRNGKYGTLYTFNATENKKKLKQMVYDNDLGDWVPVEPGTGVLYVDLYKPMPIPESQRITTPPRRSAQQREQAELNRLEAADKRTEAMIEAWRKRQVK